MSRRAREAAEQARRADATAARARQEAKTIRGRTRDTSTVHSADDRARRATETANTARETARKVEAEEATLSRLFDQTTGNR